MRRAPALFAAAIFASATSCRTLPFPDPQLHGDYGKALKKWTRRVALYAGLETRAFVRVVYLSPEFVEAQARELSRMRAELPDQAAETLSRMREEYRQPSFFVVAFMPDRTANDWDLPNSVWRLALNLGLGERAPDRILRYDTPFNAELRALYPYLDEYSVGYLLRFPEPSPPQLETNATTAQAPALQPPASFTPTEAQLIAAGALGKMVFHWRLDGGPEKPSAGVPAQQPEQ
ncbi:MAG TPA: hypothetical protein VLW85_09830 [Myxococcales bacterium]|nr:hypothetical protein [Myxococcales bacterium]